MDFIDKVILRKRASIETVNDVLKNTCQIAHSRHRSFDNFITNMISGLIAYSFLPKKPPIKVSNMLPNDHSVIKVFTNNIEVTIIDIIFTTTISTSIQLLRKGVSNYLSKITIKALKSI